MKILITGATSGIGLETAKKLVHNHHLILACRNMDKAGKVKDQLGQINPDLKLDIYHLDLSDIGSIKTFTQAIKTDFSSIDVLINNAGVFSERKAFTKDGFEMTVGTNYLGTYLLTDELIDLLKTSPHARIINVVSRAGMYGKIHKDMFTKPNKGFPPYANSKLAEIMWTITLADQLKGQVSVNAVHPGKVDTSIMVGETFMMKLVGKMNKKKLTPPEEACQIIVDMALESAYKTSGKLYERQGLIAYNKKCLDRDKASELDLMTREYLKIKPR